MTVAQEIVRVNHALRNSRGILVLPDWCLQGLVNLHIPDEADLVTQAATQAYPLGTQLRKNGRLYRYARAGEAMAAGTRGFLKCNKTRCPGLSGNSVGEGFEGAMAAAVVAGATSFTIADTAAAKNLYEDATLCIFDDTNNIYDDYRVIGNDASNGTTTTLYIAYPGFKHAVAVAVGITVYLSPYYSIGSLLTAANQSWKSALGMCRIALTSAYYFWLQTAGPCWGTGASTWPGQTAYQRQVMANTDGSLIGISAATYLYQPVGFLLKGTSASYGDVFLMLQLDS